MVGAVGSGWLGQEVGTDAGTESGDFAEGIGTVRIELGDILHCQGGNQLKGYLFRKAHDHTTADAAG